MTYRKLVNLSCPSVPCRVTQLCLRPVPKRGFSPLMMMKRTSGRRKRLTMQHKPSPETGRLASSSKDAVVIIFWSYLFMHYSWNLWMEINWLLLILFVFFSRFGGSRSSQSPAASQTCDRTAPSGTEASDRSADSDEEEPKEELDPFSSQGQAEPPKSKTCSGFGLYIRATSGLSYGFMHDVYGVVFLSRHWLDCRLWRGKLKGSSSRNGFCCLGDSSLTANYRTGRGERVGQVHRLPAFLLVSLGFLVLDHTQRCCWFSAQQDRQPNEIGLPLNASVWVVFKCAIHLQFWNRPQMQLARGLGAQWIREH